MRSLALAVVVAACASPQIQSQFADDYEAAHAVAAREKRLLAIEVWAPW